MSFKKISSFLILSLLGSFWLNAQVDFSVYYDKNENATIDSLITKNFLPFEKKINEGLTQGIYWIKVKPASNDRVIELSSSKIQQVTAYINGIQTEQIPDAVLFAFPFKANQQLLIKVTCDKDAFIPIQAYSAKEYRVHEKHLLLINGGYYGFAIMVIIINLFYFFSFKENTFLYYTLFLFSISLALFYRDGMVAFLSDQQQFNTIGEILTHNCVGIFGAVFASNYLLHEKHLPKLKYITYLLTGLLTGTTITYIITQDFFWFAINDVFAITILIIYWLSSVFLFNKNNFSKFFAIAYIFILILAFDFFISPLFGIPNLGITTNLLKISGVFEMLILSYSVIHRMRILQEEHKNMQQELYQYITQKEELENQLTNLKNGVNNTITAADLTQQEIKVLTLISQGKTNKEIAEEIHLSINTVKYHTKKLYEKLDVNSRKEARQKAVQIVIG